MIATGFSTFALVRIARPGTRRPESVVVVPRQDPLGAPAILFADRGASAHERPNSMASFRLALRLGATGLQSELRATSDGVPVVAGKVTTRSIRRRRIIETAAADLDSEVVTLAQLWAECGSDVDIRLDVADEAAIAPTLDLAAELGVTDRLWLTCSDLQRLATWRDLDPRVHLVLNVGAERPERTLELLAARLRAERIDAVSRHHQDWDGGDIAVFHRFTRKCFATDARHERMIATVLHIGIDGVSSAEVSRLVDAAKSRERGEHPPE